MYSLGNRQSFDFISKIKEHLYEMNGSNFPTILVASKGDIPREVDKNKGKLLADYWGIPYFEVSSKKDAPEKIDSIFEGIISEIKYPNNKDSFSFSFKLRKMKPNKMKNYLRLFKFL